MPAKKSKPPGEQFPLSLTEKQRESLIHATRLKRAIKTRLEGVTAGTQVILFTEQELTHLGNEAYNSLPFAPKLDKQRLEAVLGKIDDLLDAQEEKALQAKRQKAAESGKVYQLKVTLKGSKPPIWRRIQVPDCTLGQLHEIFQVVMGWEDCHLHQFIVKGEYYGVPSQDDFDMDMGIETRDEEDLLISQVATMGRKVRFTYEYDFGDSWEHDIVLEKTLEPAPNVEYPLCTAGARACPPEDCGGIWGYAHLLEALADPKHEDHEERMEWLGGEFDPEKFSVEAVNKELGEHR